MTTVGRYTVARTWELTPRLISAFAAGVDDPNPCYFDDTREGGLVGHPGLAFTFQWNTRHTPGAKVDLAEAARGVHAWVDIRYSRPFRQGDVITAQGRTIAAHQLAPGWLVVQGIRMRDAEGCDVAVMDSAGILRGVRRDDPGEQVEPLVPQPEPSAAATEPLWEAAVDVAPHAAHVYSACADIWNPIHTERTAALAAGLPDTILHGSATLTMALREVVNRSLGGDPRRIARLAGQFRAMVIPGERMTVRLLEGRETEGGRALFFDVLNAHGEAAVARGLVVMR